jgi:hypothetical protein
MGSSSPAAPVYLRILRFEFLVLNKERFHAKTLNVAYLNHTAR